MNAAAPDPTPLRSVRERLAHAAAELFESQGYDDTTIDQIATKAGVGRRTFFRHYRSKEDVIFPDHDELLLRVRERLALIPTESGITATTEAVKIVLQHYVETRDISMLRYRLVSQVPTLREREIVSVARYQQAFRERLSEGPDVSNESRLRAEVVAASVTSAHNQVLRRWLRGENTADPFVELDQALGYVADVFAGATKSVRNAGGSDLIILAFESSTPTATVVAELTRARAAGTLAAPVSTTSSPRAGRKRTSAQRRSK